MTLVGTAGRVVVVALTWEELLAIAVVVALAAVVVKLIDWIGDWWRGRRAPKSYRRCVLIGDLVDMCEYSCVLVTEGFPPVAVGTVTVPKAKLSKYSEDGFCPPTLEFPA